MEVNRKKNPLSLLYLEALIYTAAKQAFTMVPNNHHNSLAGGVRIIFLVEQRDKSQ
jgi:hypothetical protein